MTRAPKNDRFPESTVDSHVHIGVGRYGPVEDYIAVMDRMGLGYAVLVQYKWNPLNDELLEAASRHAGRFAVVVVVDPAQPDPVGCLHELARHPYVRGVRVSLSAMKSAPLDPLWDAALELGLVISVADPFDIFIDAGFRRLVQRSRGASIRIEHLAGARHAEIGPRDPRVRAYQSLADLSDSVVMCSGFWLNAADPPLYPSARLLVAATLQAWGPDRMCWSGDWNRPDIDDAVYLSGAHLLEEGLGIDDPADRIAILGGTAIQLFGFRSVDPDQRDPVLPA